MLKKLFEPKVLAIITIVSMAIYIIINFWNNTSIGGVNGLIYTFLRTLVNSNFYIMVYLLIILLAKKKNVKVLNIFLIVVLSLTFISSLLSCFGEIFDIVSVSTIFIFIDIFNSLSYGLVLFMAIGIYLRKKIPYKLIMSSAIGSLVIVLITMLVIFFYQNGLYNGFDTYSLLGMLLEIISSIGWCSFIFFMYQYGKSIERSLKSE